MLLNEDGLTVTLRNCNKKGKMMGEKDTKVYAGRKQTRA